MANAVRRRHLLALATAVLATAGAARPRAQELPIVGLLLPSAASPAQSVPLDAFLEGLAAVGLEEGRNVHLEIRAADNVLERLPDLAGDLVALGPDVIWTYSATAARAAAGATTAIPIVVGPVNENALATLVANFARPGGNVTGVTQSNLLQHEKCLQLLKELDPDIDTVAVLLNPDNPTWRDYPGALADAASALDLELVRIDAAGIDELDRAVETIAGRGIHAVFAPADGTISSSAATSDKLARLLMRRRLLSVTDSTTLVRSGGLLALTPDTMTIGRAAADYVRRILSGARPADLPVERPTVVQVIVNLRTAKALDLNIPPAILLRADEVIE